MIQIFYGDDRLKAQTEIDHALGTDYEILDGANIDPGDLDSIFIGASLFATERRILIKDLSENPDNFAKLPNYLNTDHAVIIWENKLDKRTAAYKELTAKKVTIREFKLAEAPEKKLVFDLFDLAWRGQNQQAVQLCEKIESTNDPYMTLGLLVSQAIKKLESGREQPRATRALKLLATTDLAMKSTSLDGWLLIKSMLLRLK